MLLESFCVEGKSYLDVFRGRVVSLSPIACVEVEVKPNLVHRFIPDRLISKSSYFAFLSAVNLPVRAQMQLNQDSLDKQTTWNKTKLVISFHILVHSSQFPIFR